MHTVCEPGDVLCWTTREQFAIFTTHYYDCVAFLSSFPLFYSVLLVIFFRLGWHSGLFFFFSAHSGSIQLRGKSGQVAFRTTWIGFRQSATSHSQEKVSLVSIHALIIHLSCSHDVLNLVPHLLLVIYNRSLYRSLQTADADLTGYLSHLSIPGHRYLWTVCVTMIANSSTYSTHGNAPKAWHDL
jgi:hypothetical protein